MAFWFFKRHFDLVAASSGYIMQELAFHSEVPLWFDICFCRWYFGLLAAFDLVAASSGYIMQELAFHSEVPL